MNDKRGFTLIELLVVISIIGVLASAVLVSMNAAKQKAIMSRKQTELHQVMTALYSYYLDKGSVPANKTSYWDAFGVNGDSTLSELVSGGYMTKLPASPDNQAYYYYNYGNFVIVASRMTPREHGPWQNGGWRCYPSFPNIGTDHIWCDGFYK